MGTNTYCPLLTLREFRKPTIKVECRVCARSGELDRQALVKQYGASLSFQQLRRRVSMGCPRMVSAAGIDRCETRFPDLIEAGPSLARDDTA